MEQGYVAISATKDKKAVSLRGRIQNIHSEKLDEIFGKNPYMQKIYPGDTRAALEVFCVYEALKRGIDHQTIYRITKIDWWFLDKMQHLANLENALAKSNGQQRLEQYKTAKK